MSFSPSSQTGVSGRPRVGLFVTCLVDLIRPRIGFAAIALLERAGCEVAVPKAQTCCGQPAFNSGASDHTRALAKNLIKAFEPFDYIVIPSGSCAGMIKIHYKELFKNEPAWRDRATALADRTYELLSFLTDVRSYKPAGLSLDAVATYHDSCSGLRELGIEKQPRQLLSTVQGLSIKPLAGHDVCCGFGGTFCVKYPSISNAIVDEKARDIEATGADLLIGGDLGCLMNMAGKLHRNGSKVRAFHAAEVIAGMADGPALGEEAPS